MSKNSHCMIDKISPFMATVYITLPAKINLVVDVFVVCILDLKIRPFDELLEFIAIKWNSETGI